MRKALQKFQKKALQGKGLSYEEGCEFINLPDEYIFDILASGEKVRKHFKGDEINLCSIINAKSGLCPEDCAFCAQSAHYDTNVATYPMAEPQKILETAEAASKTGAREFSIVTSGTSVSKDKEIELLAQTLQEMRDTLPMERCASLGIMDAETLQRLKDAGLQSYHHNLETAGSFFPSICSTHDYEEDVNTVRTAKELGFHTCCGGIFGLGESGEQRVELAATLRELDVDSIPINFLNPRPGTPLENATNLTPIECLKIIALCRFMLPAKDIVICGGRQVNLRDMQCLIFAAGANGMMIGNYLTTPGRPPEEDLQMIRDWGLKPKK
ncbi:MAG: biotin synthase BioB [Deltaproteobacteria bacterium]|nr:biotin synthase BioB [Deltaproteobacteria bacterium]